MAYPSIRIRDNNRRITRGIIYDETCGRFLSQITEGETLKLTLDLTDWLDSEDVDSFEITGDGVTIEAEEDDGVFTITASGATCWGDSDLTVTTEDGRVRVERFRFTQPNTGQPPDRWNYPWSD